MRKKFFKSFILLKEIKEKMYDPARAKYEYMSLMELFAHIIADTRQKEEESLGKGR